MFEFQGVTPPNTVLRPAQQGLTRKEYIENKGFTIRVLMMFLLFTMFNFNLTAQNTVEEKKQAFTNNMKTYVAQHINEKVKQLEKTPYLYEEYDSENTGLLYDLAKDKLKSEYIRMHQKEYLDTYFSEPQAMVTTDTFVCDNGGFEEDFKFYKGYIATYHHGSSSCTPVDGSGNDIVYTPALLPTNRRFEIVTTGFDPLTGIKKVKFGNKALKINDRYGHTNQCRGDFGVDKIVKRFKVTEANRDFTIWYSVALENPSGHNNRQPFLNIKCDLAPENELCFDADIIKCAQYFNDSICTFDSIDLLDWSCHRFKIPADKVGQIATLEMIVGDCGKGAHFGYAYFDGICEECDSSALGSATLDENINYFSCDGTTATVCGTYTPPTICSNGGNWTPVEVSVPGYTISNVVIDTAAKTFCFDFPLSNFGTEDCLDIYAELLFNNGVFDLPEVLTNNIDICQKLYNTYNININVSDCSSNNTDNILSDDYYFVNIDLTNISNDNWTITKQLVDPYPNESGFLTLSTGTGDAHLEFGPFYKQEGDWWLTIDIGICQYVEFIEAPGYCSGCDKFNDLEIRNIECDKNSNDEYIWSFDFYVPCNGSSTWSYSIIGSGAPSESQLCGSNITIGEQQELKIEDGCQEYLLQYDLNGQNKCIKKITICPPKPCPKEGNCDLEVYTKDVTCLEPDNNGVQGYEVELDITGTNNKHVCIFWNGISVGYIYPYLTIPYSTDVDLKIALCDDAACTQNCDDCYKWIHLSKPNCDDPRFGGKKGEKMILANNVLNKELNEVQELTVIPNPVISDEFILKSNLKYTQFTILDISGKPVKSGEFEGNEYKVSLDIPQGLYFVRYLNDKSKLKCAKLIKL